MLTFGGTRASRGVPIVGASSPVTSLFSIIPLPFAETAALLRSDHLQQAQLGSNGHAHPNVWLKKTSIKGDEYNDGTCLAML